MNENDLKLLLTKFLVDGNLRLIKQQLFWNDIVEYTSFLDKAAPRQRIWHVFNGTKKPLCLVCGANVNFFGKNYSKVCSVRCAGKCDEIKQKYKNTIQNKYRVENISQILSVKQKKKENSIIKYGVDNPAKSSEIKEKTTETNIKKYGYKSALRNSEIIIKTTKTNYIKYVTKNVMQNSEIKKRLKQTMLDRYGVDNPSKVKIFQEKKKITLFQNYGGEYVFQCPELVEKIKNTILQKRGVIFNMWDDIVADRVIKSRYKHKEFIFPSGRIDLVLGYEDIALSILLKEGMIENKISTTKKEMPKIFWWDEINSRYRRYYPDIFILDDKTFIEVKSAYTAAPPFQPTINAKIKACQTAGYNVRLMIIDKKTGNCLNSYFESSVI